MQIDSEAASCALDKATFNTETVANLVPNSIPSLSNSTLCSADVQLSEREVQDIIEMFYKPFEHGSCGIILLNEFHWLKITMKDMCGDLKSTIPTSDEWHLRANGFCQRIQDINIVFKKFCSIPNKALLYDLFPYIWDMAVVLNQLHTFTGWLGMLRIPYAVLIYKEGSPTF
jgi:hypothetical protein